MPRTALVCMILFSLSACSPYFSGFGGVTSGASVAPASVGTGLSNGDACRQACESRMARCMDSTSTRRDADSAIGGIYGARFNCEAELKSCLPGCQGR